MSSDNEKARMNELSTIDSLTTTLNLLRKAGACEGRYRHLVKALGGTEYGHDTPINLLTILEHNGVEDVEWVLSAGATVEDCAPLLAEYQRQCAPLEAEYERQRATLEAEYLKNDSLWAEYKRQRATLLAALLEDDDAK